MPNSVDIFSETAVGQVVQLHKRWSRGLRAKQRLARVVAVQPGMATVEYLPEGRSSDRHGRYRESFLKPDEFRQIQALRPHKIPYPCPACAEDIKFRGFFARKDDCASCEGEEVVWKKN